MDPLENGLRRPWEEEPEAQRRGRGSASAGAQIRQRHLGCEETQGNMAHQRPSRPLPPIYPQSSGPSWAHLASPSCVSNGSSFGWGWGESTLPWGPDTALRCCL